MPATPPSSAASSTASATVPSPPARAGRRRVLRAGAWLAGTGVAAVGVWWVVPTTASGPFASLPQAYRTLAALRDSPAHAREGWDLPQVLHHAAQSIEYSMTGYPELKGRWFRASIGAAAFAVFGHAHAMHHDLGAPIPGAPALAAGQPLGPAVDHAIAALQAFERHAGPLAPHFAYGDLDKQQYQVAHLLHFSDHWRRIEG